MNEKRINEIISAMGTDEDQIKALLELSPEEAAAKFKAQGFEVSADELVDFGKYCAEHVDQSGEINETQLENVSGGSIMGAAFLVGVIGGMILARKNPW